MSAPLDELDEMIAQGWGDVDRDKIPADWRTRRGPSRTDLWIKPGRRSGYDKPKPDGTPPLKSGPRPKEVRERLHAEMMERNFGRQRRLAAAQSGCKKSIDNSVKRG